MFSASCLGGGCYGGSYSELCIGEASLAVAAECCVPRPEDRELSLHSVGVNFTPRVFA